LQREHESYEQLYPS